MLDVGQTFEFDNKTFKIIDRVRGPIYDNKLGYLCVRWVKTRQEWTKSTTWIPVEWIEDDS